jgi:methylmalonyl-CoA/ethylmalonyl-CoA epimerase
MPSGPLAHICLLVKDLDQAVEDWTKILRALDPGQLAEQMVHYDEFEGGEDSMRWATFVSHHGAEIQLMQPTPDSPLGRRLAKHGEGVHHICFTTDDPAAVSRRLAEEGLNASDELFSDPEMPWQRWSWVMPDSAHGTLVEVARPYKAVDGKWVSGSASDPAPAAAPTS